MKNTLMAALLAAVLLAAPAVLAQVPQFDLERLTLDPSAVSSLVIGTGEILPVGQGRVSAAVHYENRPLVKLTDGQLVGRGLPYDGTRLGDVVGDRVTVHLGAAVTVTELLEVNFRLPVVAWQDATKGLPGVAPVTASGLASPSAGLRVKFMDQESAPLNAALGLEIIAPWGTGSALAGNTQWLFAPRLELGHRF
jgi:OOP family OmpA-OmpF porin